MSLAYMPLQTLRYSHNQALFAFLNLPAEMPVIALELGDAIAACFGRQLAVKRKELQNLRRSVHGVGSV